jgi:glycosyltransferase involved in cell wall biosynthesis
MAADDRLTPPPQPPQPPQPLVSVLMTAFNREKYIGAAIESVLASGYKNFELIITDDGSKDDTLRIAERYTAGDPRVRVHRNPTNLGDYPNRNQAAAYATGKYIKYVDADDYLYPWGLGLLVSMMEEFPDAGWGLCSLLQVPERPYPFLLHPKEAYWHHYAGPGLFHKAPLSAIIKRDAFWEAGGFSPSRMVGDFEMWHRLALRFPVVLMPDGIVWYREHSEQEMGSHRMFILEYERIRMQYLHHADCPLEGEQVKEIIRKRRRFLMRCVLSDMFKGRFSSMADNYKTLQTCRF